MIAYQFIAELKSVPSTETVNNQYLNPTKVKNFEIYLNYMIQNRPKHILIGEAPGYRGCALSGIPFTDEYRLTPNGSVGCLPLTQSGYRILSQKPHREGSATVIWESFSEKAYFPMLWNIFPFHPHKQYNLNSNRTPTSEEVARYNYFVNDLLRLLPSIQEVFAVGRTSEKMLNEMGIRVTYIRHPANGGSKACRTKILSLTL